MSGAVPDAASVQPEEIAMSLRQLLALTTIGLTSAIGGIEARAQDNPVVVIETSLGTITAELDRANAPISVENFLSYVEEKAYSGTVFHRVIKGFMIQGGAFTAEMEQLSSRDPIKNEATNGLTNDRGTLAMARTNVVDSATRQFFINTVDNNALNNRGTTSQTYGYAVFGRVTEGLDVVDQIENVATGSRGSFRDLPNTPVVIESITVQQ
jgi:cyclophilin family peptidyl-prolyl cis-trans isomerase